jgi:hypothetical protein
MKRFFLKCAILAAPFAALLAIELFVLPIDFFAFRPWEALLAREIHPAAGPFYPNMHLVKLESADQLGFKDPHPKINEWFTDKYGFRNRPSVADDRSYDIVVIGDSNVVGSNLDQKQIISEVLSRKCKCSTYSYGSGGKRQYMTDPRFKKHPPRAVVAEARTGELYVKKVVDLYYADLLNAAPAKPSWLPPRLAILADRIVKMNMLEYMKARMGVQLHVADAAEDTEFSPQERVKFASDIITEMDKEVRRRGSDFVFFMMPGTDRSLDDALRTIMANGVKTIAYFPTNDLPHGVNIQAYYKEHDSHWREAAVRYFADDVLAKLGWKNYAPESARPEYLKSSNLTPSE